MTEHRVDWGPFCHEPGRTVSVSIRALQRSRGNTPTGTRSAQSLQLRPTLCDHVDCSPPGSSVMGSSRQEHWSGLPCPPPRDLPHPGIEPVSLVSPALAGGFFTASATWEALGLPNPCDKFTRLVCFSHPPFVEVLASGPAWVC